MSDTATHKDAGILVIDADSIGARHVVDVLMGAGYQEVSHSADYEGLLTKCPTPKEVDLVVLDVRMQGAEGVALLEVLRQQNPPDEFFPVVAVGPAASPRLAVSALHAGASDYVSWPLDADEFLARIGVQLEIRSLCRRLQDGKRAVEDLLERLARVAELRDDPSGSHPARVGRLAGLIAQELMLPAEETRCLLRAAPLHDLGNLGIADHIVRLEGNFTDEQREQMQEHTSLGAYLLHGTENSVLQMAELIALNHHERWDGLGYPQGLSRTDIPMVARIVAVADALDAMTHPGLYKEPCSIATALDELQREAGWQFDPEVLAALVRVHERQPDMLTITPRAPRRVAV